MANNPDLLQPGSQVTVAPLHVITRPYSNTKAEKPVYFFCSLPTASFHRPDGKKLPFVNNFLKCEILEDIEYLRNEVSGGNPYLREASPDEVQAAKMKENPVEAIKESVRKEVESSYSIEDLQKMIEERKKASVAAANGDAARIAGTERQVAKDTIQAVGAVFSHAAHTGANTGNLAAGIKLNK